ENLQALCQASWWEEKERRGDGRGTQHRSGALGRMRSKQRKKRFKRRRRRVA
ncbi:unnamed protein product, partial [Ascophyllum nodosum]